jgi:hypothetical protein
MMRASELHFECCGIDVRRFCGAVHLTFVAQQSRREQRRTIYDSRRIKFGRSVATVTGRRSQTQADQVPTRGVRSLSACDRVADSKRDTWQSAHRDAADGGGLEWDDRSVATRAGVRPRARSE